MAKIRRKPTAAPVSAPAPSKSKPTIKRVNVKVGSDVPRTNGKPNRFKLSAPVKAETLKTGMRVHYSGAMCRVAKVTNPAHSDFPHLLVIAFDQHPERTAFSTVARRGDMFFTRITESWAE